MGRKKSYDRGELVEKAMEIFRDHGFAGTSAEMLVEGLGVNRYSLYTEFGSKQELFNTALQRYDEVVVERNFGPLEFFASAGGGPSSGRGCLLCNTAVEFGPNDPSGAGFVQRYFKRLSEAFFAALNNAQNRGELRRSVDPRMEADFFTASVLGLFVMLRAKASPTIIESAVHVAISHLESLRA
jgi:TetR/AcrR family transcriptional repressor of nem operon